MINQPATKRHCFLDEAGDTTFYGKGKTPILGNEGVSKCFILGMLELRQPIAEVRSAMLELQHQIAADPYFSDIASIRKKKSTTGYFAHAKDDVPEVRKLVFEFINTLDCNFEAVVARKKYQLFEKKHNGKDTEFYADLLSHLLKSKLHNHELLVLNISHRGKCTSHLNLNLGLEKGIERSAKENFGENKECKVVFNVQFPTQEPILSIADYFCWAIQRVFEKGETRFYNFIKDKVSSVIDIYDFENMGNYYSPMNPLTILNHLK